MLISHLDPAPAFRYFAKEPKPSQFPPAYKRDLPRRETPGTPPRDVERGMALIQRRVVSDAVARGDLDDSVED